MSWWSNLWSGSDARERRLRPAGLSREAEDKFVTEVERSLREEPERWKHGYHTFDGPSVSLWASNYPYSDMNVYLPTEIGVSEAGAKRLREAVAMWSIRRK